MGEPIHHECGIAFIRLRKDLQYFEQNHGSALHGFNKLFLLMEKQHNRGQDGAGIGAVKLSMPLGRSYMFRERELNDNSLAQLFKKQLKRYDKLVRDGKIVQGFASTVKEHFDFGAEVLMGHLRYGTSGDVVQGSCHPYFRRSSWPTRNLMVLGNFNMTNTAELNEHLVRRGQHPIFDTDTQTILEEIGFNLDEEHDRIYREMRDQGIPGHEIPAIIAAKLDLAEVLRRSAAIWDGGYVIAGMIGTGDAFVMRDANGIRPAYYLATDELVAFASERVPLMTVFDASRDQIHEVPPGQAALVRADGALEFARIAGPAPRASCSFERIYFSRGNDPEIYRERAALGGALVDQIMEAIGGDLENTVFSFIPNTAEIAYYGLMRALRERRRAEVKKAILEAQRSGPLEEALLDQLILSNWPRGEKVAHKDIKLRTFISQEKGRSKLVSHVYDITYDLVTSKDNLVVLDDSIVRGTTLRESTLKILSRTQPRKIIIASTAPQIRYPDCYGIDMSELGKFIAFQAAVEILRTTGRGYVLEEIYRRCAAEVRKPRTEQENCVRAVYEPFTPEEISRKIVELVRPRDIPWQGEIAIVFQTIENLHASIPDHRGDWYFTGRYPTPGGTAICNQAFLRYYEHKVGRSY